MNDGSSDIPGLGPEDVSAFAGNVLEAATEATEGGQLDEAEKLFRCLVDLTPKDPEAHNGLGVVFGMAGNFRAAEKQFRNAIKFAPDVVMYHRNLGSILLQQGRFRRAGEELSRALELDPADVDSRHKLAKVHNGRGNLAGFEAELLKILKQDPLHVEASHDLGCYMISKGQITDGTNLLEIACRSEYAGSLAYINFGNALIISGDLVGARKAFQCAVELTPLGAECLMGLATVERNLGELRSALTNAEKASSLATDNAAAKNLLGTIYKELGDYEQALSLYNKALVLTPGYTPAKINRAIIHLMYGAWETGFREYETRLEDAHSDLGRNSLSSPLWDGSPLQGRQVFLYAEQGFGDAIQFSRFANTISAQGGKVILEVRSELYRLMKSLDKSVKVIKSGADRPETDVHAPLMSLGYLLGIQSKSSFLPAPYLEAPKLPKGVKTLLEGLDGLKVGLNWRGASTHKEDAKRSIDLKLLESLLMTEKVHFFSLNVSSENKLQPLPGGLVDLSDHISDFYDAASIMSHLDLVISVDTATVHLAGAIGCPCWALISFVPDWRWGLEHTDTIWYESVRLYRQPAIGDWPSVLDHLKSDLENLRDD